MVRTNSAYVILVLANRFNSVSQQKSVGLAEILPINVFNLADCCSELWKYSVLKLAFVFSRLKNSVANVPDLES